MAIPGMLAMAGLSAGASIVTTIIGKLFEDPAADEYTRKALDEINNLEEPDEQKLQRVLIYLGDYKPELLQSSAMEELRADPQSVAAMRGALQQMSGIVDEEGLTAEDKSRLAQIQQQAAMQDRARREASMGQMAQRGLAGSGLEMAQQLAGQQATAGQQSQAGLEVAAQAEKAKREAIQNMFGMGSQLRSQQWGEGASVATARDRINAANNQLTNQAKLRNMTEQQRISDENEAARAGAYQTALAMRNQNKMARSGAFSRYGESVADKNRQTRSDVGNLIGGGVGAYQRFYGSPDMNIPRGTQNVQPGTRIVEPKGYDQREWDDLEKALREKKYLF